LWKLEGVPKQTGKSSCPRGRIALTGDDPVEGCRTGPDRGQVDLQEPEGLGVDDIEATATIHEDLGEPGVANDGVENERVPS
jgi:hypothetical protein